mmetsp:Transcript_5632/g.20165  ORF Transcript_5632/g.20165 Transcript_5632/m.20165 type:complete len:207 (+) Transcript_5632:231-851(+)
MPSDEPAPTRSPSCDHATRCKLRSRLCSAPTKVRVRRSPAQKGRTSHARTVRSMALDSSVLPSGLTAKPVTVSLWPFSVSVTSPVLLSHARMSLSSPAANTRSPASANATVVTGKRPSNVCAASLYRGSHSRTVPSSLPVAASVCPRRVVPTALTMPRCPLNLRTRSPVVASKHSANLSADAENTCSQSDDHAQSSTAFLCPFSVS